jgi:O-antigen/teichoic acid export membrane protein
VARLERRRFAGDSRGLSEAIGAGLRNTTVILFPLCVGGAAVAPTLFHVWLDARWLAAIPPAQMLITMCAPFVTHYFAGAALLAFNFQPAEALLTVVQTLLTLGVVLAFGPFGINIASAAFAARPLVLLPLPLLLLKRKCGVSPWAVLRAQRPAFLASCVMGAVVTVLRLALEPLMRDVILLPLLIVVGAAVYASLIALMLPDWAARYIAALPLGRWRRRA